MGKKKIALVIDSLEIGGANILTIELANSLVCNNFDVSIFSLSDEENKSKTLLDSMNKQIKIKSLHLFSVNFMNRLKLLNKSLEDFDIIHSCLESANFYTTLLRFINRREQSLIITYHGVDALYINDEILKIILKRNQSFKNLVLMKYFQNFLFKYSDQIISVSKDTKLFLIRDRHIEQKKIKVIYHGIMLDKLSSPKNCHSENTIKNSFGITESDFVIGYCGRLAYAKGLEFLIESFSKLSIDTNFKLLLIGDGMLRKEIEDKINKYNLSERCFITGFVSNIQDYYNLLNLFVLPSSSEGIPLSLLEAMYLKKITLSSNVGGIPEVIENGFNGFIYNSPEDFGLKINYIYANYDHLSDVGINAYETVVKTFDFSINVQKVVDIIMTV